MVYHPDIPFIPAAPVAGIKREIFGLKIPSFPRFRLGGDEQPLKRLRVLTIVVIPPFILAYSGMVSFVNALYFAGVFSGVILSTCRF